MGFSSASSNSAELDKHWDLLLHSTISQIVRTVCHRLSIQEGLRVCPPRNLEIALVGVNADVVNKNSEIGIFIDNIGFSSNSSSLFIADLIFSSTFVSEDWYISKSILPSRMVFS